MSTQLHKKRSFISTTDRTIERYRNLNSITISYQYATVPFTLSFNSPPIPQKLWQEKRSNEKIKNSIFICSAGVTSLLNNNTCVVFSIIGELKSFVIGIYMPKLAFKYTMGWDPITSFFLSPKGSLCNGNYPLPRYPKWFDISGGYRVRL